MTARKSGSRLETEIERCRSEGQWDKIPELVRQLSAKLISNDDLGELLLGEAKLQQYLKENPIKQGASPRGPRPRLQEVRKHLTAALDRGNLKVSLNCQDHHFCLLYHARTLSRRGVYLSEGNPRSRVILMCFCLCLEKVPMASPSLSNRNVDRDQEIITCYEKSGDIALLYLQEVEKALSVGIQNRSPKPGPVTQEQELGYFLETGLQRAHVIHFKNGNLTRGVGRFREILRAVETRTTQNLRMTIARQLAEILLRGMCEQSYWNPLEDPPHHSPLDDPLRHTPHTKDYALSRRPRIYSGENLFCPQENTEEALLLLLISESMANRDAVLSRIPEHNNDRIISLQSASLVYDLLTIALGRRGQYEMLSEVRSCPHSWEHSGILPPSAGRVKPPGVVAFVTRPDLHSTLPLYESSLRGMQEEYQKKALSAFQEALGYVRQALQLQGDDVHSLHLLALLLSAQKHYHDALNIIEMALSEYPENFILLFTKVKLETLCRGPEEALLSCKRMLQIWKSCYNLTNPRYTHTHTPIRNKPQQCCFHCFLLITYFLSLCLSTAEVYIGMGKAAEATACTQEAANLFPMSHNVLFMKGQVAELRGNVDEAKRWYEEALSISPTHVKTMQRLSLILHQLQRYSLAEKILRDAVQVNSTAHDVWNSLGEVLQAQGNDAAATECFLTALELEASCPILPFTIIPRTL
uniref:Tetratricopeptide repeat domain 7B n=1 Tax=Sinocyclocheilus grahami TaxID=75366 RepID=A0A672P150_SINGR